MFIPFDKNLTNIHLYLKIALNIVNKKRHTNAHTCIPTSYFYSQCMKSGFDTSPETDYNHICFSFSDCVTAQIGIRPHFLNGRSKSETPSLQEF